MGSSPAVAGFSLFSFLSQQAEFHLTFVIVYMLFYVCFLFLFYTSYLLVFTCLHLTELISLVYMLFYLFASCFLSLYKQSLDMFVFDFLNGNGDYLDIQNFIDSSKIPDFDKMTEDELMHWVSEPSIMRGHHTCNAKSARMYYM